jgi:FkbM family methyltransferase
MNMIKTIRHYGRNSPGGYLWRRLKRSNSDNHPLPTAASHSLEGVTLSLDGLSPRMKRAIIEGIYEKAEITIARQLINEGDQILELGAAIGFVGLFCLTAMNAKSVVSVEANPETAARLRKNYEINRRMPELIEAAASQYDGSMELSVGEDFWEDSLTSRPDRLRRIPVRTLSLPSLLRESRTSFNCFIVDVEGSEIEIDWQTMPSAIEKIIIELHPEFVGFPASYRILNKIQNFGFDVVSHVGGVYGLKRELHS